MPHSYWFPTSLMLEHVSRIRPRRVLDVGIGFGKWGFLIREALDFTEGRLEPATWETEIIGVEAYEYVSPLHDWVYDRVIRADVRDVVGELSDFDLVVLGDVIEHLSKDDGRVLLDALLLHNRTVLVSTPLDFFEQDIAGNHYERHLSHWSRRDFTDWTYDYDVAGGAAIVVVLAGASSTYPAMKDSKVSAFVYGLPGLQRRGAAAHLLKRMLVGTPGT